MVGLNEKSCLPKSECGDFPASSDYAETLSYVNRLSKERLGCGKNLLDLTTYDGITLWWFLKYRFGYFLLNPGFYSSSKSRSREAFLARYYSVMDVFPDALGLTFADLLLKAYGGKKAEDQNGEASVMITSLDIEWRAIRDYQTNTTRISDAFFDSLIQELKVKRNYKISGICPIAPSGRSVKILLDKLKNWNVVQRPFNIYWTADIWRNERACHRHFSEIWRSLENDEVFRNLCGEGRSPLFPDIFKKFEYYFKVTIPHNFKYIEMAKEMLKREQPHIIILENEYGEFQRALVAAARTMGVPTLAIQHGVISSTEAGYIFDRADIGSAILPDVTCVYGRYHYDLLTSESIYRQDQVVVTGPPRYDILYHVGEIFSKERFLKENSIERCHKILLWTTQCHALGQEENIKNFEAVFGAAESIKDLTLIVKQHPGEGESYTRKIEDQIKKHDANIIIAPKDSNTYEQLFVCDLMITKHSVTAMEAIALKKPVIVLNLGGKPDVVDYVTEGVAMGVYSENDLKVTIERLLKDDSALAKNRDKYIEKYLYKIDGRATERVVDAIQGLLMSGKGNPANQKSEPHETVLKTFKR